MPGMAGTEYPRAGAQDRARRQARAADRLRRHRGRDRRDQRGRARLLPAQAVGSARGAALPGASRTCSRPGSRARRCESGGRAHHRPPLLEGLARPARLPGAQPASRRAGSTSSATARRASCCRSSASTTDRLPVALLEDGTVLERPTVLELAERLGVDGAAGAEHYDLVDRRRRPGRARGRGLRRVGGPADGAGRARGARAARPASRAGSRTTSASRLGLSGSDLARRATDQARRLGAELLTVQDAVGLRVEGAGRHRRADAAAAR